MVLLLDRGKIMFCSMNDNIYATWFSHRMHSVVVSTASVNNSCVYYNSCYFYFVNNDKKVFCATEHTEDKNY